MDEGGTLQEEAVGGRGRMQGRTVSQGSREWRVRGRGRHKQSGACGNWEQGGGNGGHKKQENGARICV